jgi:ribonuclease R
MPKNKHRTGLPTREQILDFIAVSDQPAGKREIAKAFGLRAGQDRAEALLKDMADEGLIDSAPGRAFHKMGGVPKVTVLRVVDVDDSGAPGRCRSAGRRRAPEPRSACRSEGPGAPRSASATASSPAPRRRATAGSPTR